MVTAATEESSLSPALLTADPARCVGAGQCVLTAPRVFDQGDDGQVIVLEPRPAADLVATVREAVDRCPGRALGLGPGALSSGSPTAPHS
ncbi:protein of unknown function DUF1271 [Actinobacteria bacterium OK074]|nr:protein of unknown function DUF1271 [Actinobacteria bacterium OK074]